MTLDPSDTICCSMPKTTTKKKERDDPELIREWSLPVAATLGSAVRVKGILQEIRSRLPSAVRKSLDMQSSALTLVMPESSKTSFRATSAIISAAREDIAGLPIIPREIEEILTITASERLAGGRAAPERGNENGPVARPSETDHLSHIRPTDCRRSARPRRRGRMERGGRGGEG